MRAILLSSASKRLILSAALSAALFAAGYLLIAVIAFSDARERWTWQFGHYSEWTNSGESARCEKLFSGAKPYLRPSSCIRPSKDELRFVGEKVIKYANCEAMHQRQLHESVSKFLDSGCPIRNDPRNMLPPNLFGIIELERAEDYVLELNAPLDPGPFYAYAWDSISSQINWPRKMEFVVLFVVPMFAFFFLSCIMRDLILETHLGWRRLTIVASGIGTIAVPAIYLDDLSNPSLAIAISVAALIGSAAFVIYGRKLFLWVYSGFKSVS